MWEERVTAPNLDGTGDALFLNTGNGPAGIALDVANNKIYWTEASAGKVRSATLSDGSGATDLFTGLNWPYGVGVDLNNNKMYYGSRTKIGRANLDGTSSEDIVTSGLSLVMGITVGPTTSTPAPEINVKQDTTDIADGGTADFGSVSVGSHTDVEFTIENTGNEALTLGAETIAGTNSGDFAIQGTFPAGPIAAGQSETFTVRFTPGATGARSATISFVNGDDDEDPYDFTLTGTGTVAPEINVQGNSNDITDGDTEPSSDDHTDFGSVNTGNSLARTFTIQNSGNTALTVGDITFSGDHPDDFSVTTDPASSVAAGESTTFQVTFTPSAETVRRATLSIVNNDSDEAPYDFAIQGTGVAAAPEIEVTGNSNPISDGSSTAQESNHTDFGTASVSGGTVERIFTIQNTGNADLTISGDVSISGANADDFEVTDQPDSPVASGGNSTFVVQFDPSAAGVRSASITITNNDADENPYNFAIQGTGTAPEINVKQGTMDIADGSGTKDFGSVSVGSHSEVEFTIQNTGNEALTLGAETIGGTNLGDFAIQGAFPSSSIAANGSTTFTVRFTPATTGARSATISFVNGDADEDPYDFTLTGTGITPEIELRGNNVSISSGKTITDTSDHTDFGEAVVLGDPITHTFTISNTGTADLNLTGSPNKVSVSPTGTFTVTTPPTSPIAAGASSNFVIEFAPSITGVHTTTVSIANDDLDENPYTLVIGGTGVTPEIDVSGNEQSITDGDTTPSTSDDTDFGTILVASNITRTFTISNTGTSTLTLSLPITLSHTTNFTVTSQPSDTIAAGQVSTFTVTFRPTATQLYTATVSIVNDDLDENPYDFVIQGTGRINPPNQGPQLSQPLPDIRVSSGAAARTLNLLSYFSDPEGNPFFFRIIGNSNPSVVPSPTVGQQFDNELRIQFGSPGQSEITVEAVESHSGQTYQDSFMVTVQDGPSPTLSMSQTVSDNEVQAGQEITYTIMISNSGPGTATNAEIRDSLPTGLTFMSGSISATGLGGGTLGTAPPVLASGVTLAANQTLELSFMATVNNDMMANHMMTNTVELTADEMSTPMEVSSMIMVVASTEDQDVDGVNNDIEDQVPNANGEGTGDGNGDGVPDSSQDNVASLPNGTNGEYVTFAAASNQAFNGVTVVNTPADAPEGANLTQGVFNFGVLGVNAGEAASVQMILHTSDGQSLPNSYWKYGPTPDNTTPHWYNFEFDGTTGAQIEGNTITLHFVDGQRGDDDLTANGQIRDPGAPAIYTAPTAVTLTQMDTQSSSNWLLIVSGLMTLLALGALRLRWRRG